MIALFGFDLGVWGTIREREKGVSKNNFTSSVNLM